MLELDAAFDTAIAEGTVKVAELYEITLSDGSTFRYTSHNEDITWGASDEVWTAIPITRGPISTKISLEADAVVLSLANISGDLFDEVQKNVLDSAQVTIKRILWNETYAAGMEATVFVGTADVEFDRQILVLRCKSILDSLNIQVPKHIYQEPCNNQHYGTTCTLTRTDFAYAGTATGGTDTTLIDTTRGTVYKVAFDGGDEDNPVEIGDALVGDDGTPGDGVCVNITYVTAATGFIWYVENTHQFVDDEVITGGGNTVTVNGTPAADTEFYEQGELEITSGANSGQRRPILKDSVNTATVIWPFTDAIVNGVTYNMYPGCDKRSTTCTNKFDNDINFRGFIYIPKVEETIM